MRCLLALWLVAAGTLSASLAGAEPRVVGEPRLWLGAAPAWLTLARSPYEASGAAGLHVGARAPLNDQFHLLVELQTGTFGLRRPAPVPCPEPPAPCAAVDFPYKVQVLAGSVGVSYLVDVTRLTPSFGALFGVSRLGAGDSIWSALQGQRALEQHVGVTLAGGLDYRLAERWSLGLVLRWFLSAGSELTTVGLQVQRAVW